MKRIDAVPCQRRKESAEDEDAKRPHRQRRIVGRVDNGADLWVCRVVAGELLLGLEVVEDGLPGFDVLASGRGFIRWGTGKVNPGAVKGVVTEVLI